MEKRIDYIDVTKGILLSIVVFSHGCGFMWGSALITVCYMPAFFMLGGYTYRSCDIFQKKNELINKRIKGLIIPYVFWTIVILTIRNIHELIMGSFQ